jgi:hypothetical protein
MGTKVKMTDSELQAIADMMVEATEVEGGMKALAAIIAPPIEQEIDRREITSLLLTKIDLPASESAKFQMAGEGIHATWISADGDVCEDDIKGDEVEFPIGRLASNPMVDISVLKHGNVGTLADILKKAGKKIRIAVDTRTISVLSAAVPAANIIECSGGKLTEDAFSQAESFIEDQELPVKYILMRGARVKDMAGWELDPVTERELVLKGIFKRFNGAEIIASATMNANEVILIGDDEVGKYAIRQKLTTQPIEVPLRFKTGWLAWLEAAIGVTNPGILAKIVITA